jgi:hypothetical protein
MEMVPPSIFPSKTYGNPRQRHVALFKIRHVATLFFFFFLILRPGGGRTTHHRPREWFGHPHVAQKG